MVLQLPCPNAACGKGLTVAEEQAGQTVLCSFCGTAVVVPRMGVVAAPAASRQLASGIAVAPRRRRRHRRRPATLLRPAAEEASLELLTWAGLAAGVCCLLLLALSPLCNWISQAEPPLAVAGIRFANGRLLVCLALLPLGVLGHGALARRISAGGVLLAASVGTFAALMLIGHLLAHPGSDGGGLWLGLLASLGVVGVFVALALHQPLELEVWKRLEVPCLEQYGSLLAAEALAVLFGMLYWMLNVF